MPGYEADNALNPSRKRSSRACDACKARRSKCEDVIEIAESSLACKACREENQRCLFTLPVRKRGPAPGFKSQNGAAPLQTQHPVTGPLATTSSRTIRTTPGNNTSYSPSSAAPSPRPPYQQQGDTLLGIPTGLVDQLLGVYFTHVHNVWPLVCKPSFNIHNTSAHFLLCMLAVAACVAPEAAAEGVNSESLFAMAERALQKKRNEHRIDIIQSYMVMSLRQTGCGDKKSAAMYANRASILTLAMGLHLDSPTPPGTAEKSSAYDHDTRSRVYWNCYVLDKVIAEETGRPFLLTYRRASTPLPSINEVDEFEAWPPLPISSASLPQSVQHVHTRRGYVLSSFVWTCRLGMIVEEIMDLETEGPNMEETGEWWDAQFAQESKERRDAGRHIDRIAKQLDLWWKALPAHLVVDVKSNLSPLPHHVINTTWYHIARILLYSRFLKKNATPRGGSEEADRSLEYHAICSEAAQAVVDLVSLLDRHRLLAQICSDMIHHLSLTTLFEAYETVSTDAARANRAKINFSQCCLWLREISACWPASSAHRVFFEGLIQGGLQLSTTTAATGQGGEYRPTTRAIAEGLQSVHTQLSPQNTTTTALKAGQSVSPPQPSSDLALTTLLQLPQYYWNQLTVNETDSQLQQPAVIPSDLDLYNLSAHPGSEQSFGLNQSPVSFGSNSLATSLNPSIPDGWGRRPGNVRPEGSQGDASNGHSGPGDHLASEINGADQDAIYSALMTYMMDAVRGS